MPAKCFYNVLLLLTFPLWSVSQLTYNRLKVEYDSAWTYKNLQLIPVRFKGLGDGAKNEGNKPVNTQSLANAMAGGKVKVKEVIHENGADISWLQVINNSKQDVIINSGDLLAGGKQDRMIGETKIVASGTTDYLKVYCVEKGRWDDKARPFKFKGSANHPVKKVMDRSARQHDIWREIERQFTTRKIKSKTWPLVQLQQTDTVALNDYMRFFMGKYQRSDSAFAGFLAITANHILNCELFATADLTTAAYPSLISRLVQTVQNESPPIVTRNKMELFLNMFMISEDEQKVYLATHGQMYTYNGRVIHLVAYPD